MTIVVPLNAFGVPVLIGDLLISRGGLAAGTSKKIQRFGPTVALGWSGRRIEAKAMFSALGARLPANPTAEDVARLIVQAAAAQRPAELDITGWALSPKATPIYWSTAKPREVHTDHLTPIGSLPQWLLLAIGGYELGGSPPPVDDFSRGACGALHLIGRLMSSELSLRDIREEFCAGAGYEALVADEAGFRYLSPVVYVALGAMVDANGELEQMSAPWGVALVRSIGEITFRQILSDYSGERLLDMVQPLFHVQPDRVHKRLGRWVLRQRTSLVFKGDYCVVFIQFWCHGAPWPPFVATLERGHGAWIGSSPQGVTLNWSFIRNAAKTIAAREAEKRGQVSKR